MESITTKEFVDIISKGFTLNRRVGREGCAVCEHLPMDKLCEATFDIIFKKYGSFDEMERYYTPFAVKLVADGKVLGEHRFRHHKDKCCKDPSVFTDDDLRKLGLLDDQAIKLQRLYDFKNQEALLPDAQRTEIRRHRYNNLSIFEGQRKYAQENVILLEQGILPKYMKVTYQPQSGSCIKCGHVVNIPMDYGGLLQKEKATILGLTKQIDVILSDLEKNNASAERASKSNTTVIQVMNSSITDMENKFVSMLDDVKSSLDILLPNQPEIITQVMRVIVNQLNNGVHPILVKTKEILEIESK